ncbi:MAG: hypothetical protein ACYCZD_01450 [Rhodanobacter sp.]
MTAILIDRNRSASPNPRDGSRRVTIEAVGTPMVRTPGIVSDKR